jgi:L-amino acid N-acyltransferase YncA
MIAHIRAATAGDAPAIAALWNQVIRDTLITFNPVEKSPDEVARLITARAAAGRAFLVADGPEGIVGFATYDQFRAGEGYARTMEHSINLVPGAWGQGIGRRLMVALEDHARQAGVHVMVAAVSGGNPAGRAFHARLGYAEVGVMAQVGTKFGRFLDLVLMQKILD